MKRWSKERRVFYMGFDDKWFMIIGVIILSFVMDFMFNNSFLRDIPTKDAIFSWGVSLFFSTFYWSVTREVLIQFRKRLPELKNTAKRVLFFTLVLIGCIFIVDLVGTVILESMGVHFNPQAHAKTIMPIIIVSMMVMAIYEAIYFYTMLMKSVKEEEEAKRGIVQAQLDALRNQAQPHFFFNTMNTLRDIIDQNTKEEAMNFVDKISDVYRFILESENSNLIPLSDELKFAKAYVHIQSERFGSNLQVDWMIDEEMLMLNIVPMSLQLLLENAIKHNVVSKSKPLRIKVNVAAQQVSVSNPIQLKSTKLASTKLGLRNIKDRYRLISDKEVKIEEGENFKVTLPLLEVGSRKQVYAGVDH